jgi:coproporphyrinogen III oxidase
MSVQSIESVKENFSKYVQALQQKIIDALKLIDADMEITPDPWQRTDQWTKLPGGGGLTCALAGSIIENAGVNTSLVFGRAPAELQQKLFQQSASGQTVEMWATGISLIIHPRNPRAPTVHANFRMLEMGGKVWFGGGADLTPYYPHREDFAHFHNVWKKACAPYGFYQNFKDECDRYFVNTHRDGEMRGIGGIFFDHYNSGDLDRDLAMVKHLGDHFLTSYLPILEKRHFEPWEAQDVEFQLHRRGRYVEFNLLHDRGTTFGLKTGGRTESILISLPGRCKFSYQYAPAAGTPHAEMMTYYRPHVWADQ